MANNLDIKDGAGAAKIVKATDNSGVYTPHQNIDSLPALPTGTNTVGTVLTPFSQAGDGGNGDNFAQRSGKTIVHAAIDIAVATVGNNTIVAAQGAGLRIRVTELYLRVGAATTLKWTSANGGTVLCGAEDVPANGGCRLVGDGNMDYFRFSTAANEALVLNSSAAVKIGGFLKYVVEA